MKTFAKLIAGTALAVGVIFWAAAAGASPAAGGANLSLASSLIASGGGPGSYSTVRAFNAMIGEDAVLANERQIATTYGQTNEDRFVHMFDYAIADAWQLAGKNNVSLPPASATGGQALATQLVQAGVAQGGTFDGGSQRQVWCRGLRQLRTDGRPVLPQHRYDGRNERLVP